MSSSAGSGGTAAAARPGGVLTLAPHHHVYLAFFTSIILVFTVASVIFQTHTYNVLVAQSPRIDLKPVASIWASKANPINRIFIKKAWLWTTLADLAQVLTLRAPPSASEKRSLSKGKGKAREEDTDGAASSTTPEDQDATIASPLAKSLLRWFIATIAWLSFAVWLFGPSLMQRILTLSGGICIPREDLTSSSATGHASSGFRLPQTRIDDAFCVAGSRGISKEERPDLFRTAHTIVTDSIAGGKLRGSWKGGHDASGHTFILLLSSLLLLEEVTPYLGHFANAVLPPSIASTLKRWIPSTLSQGASARNPYRGESRVASLAATWFILLLVSLWTFSLVNTALFFHTPSEKVSGALIALSSWFLLPKGG